MPAAAPGRRAGSRRAGFRLAWPARPLLGGLLAGALLGCTPPELPPLPSLPALPSLPDLPSLPELPGLPGLTRWLNRPLPPPPAPEEPPEALEIAGARLPAEARGFRMIGLPLADPEPGLREGLIARYEIEGGTASIRLFSRSAEPVPEGPDTPMAKALLADAAATLPPTEGRPGGTRRSAAIAREGTPLLRCLVHESPRAPTRVMTSEFVCATGTAGRLFLLRATVRHAVRERVAVSRTVILFGVEAMEALSGLPPLPPGVRFTTAPASRRVVRAGAAPHRA